MLLMKDEIQSIIKEKLQVNHVEEKECIQQLWSGYGRIVRFQLDQTEEKSVIVKHVLPPNETNHPRGWNTNFSHLRKLTSYEVEISWYKKYAQYCSDSCRIPKCYHTQNQNEEMILILEDLDASGYAKRIHEAEWKHMQACIKWLANFHATFLHQKPDELWEIGTYWHLNTRPDELKVMGDKNLKKAAKSIDQKLNESPYLTFVHGDAKLANFCFAEDGTKVAAVDFQYVGGGCGMKDLAYFVGSCLYEEDCERLETTILDEYFRELKSAVSKQNLEIDWKDLEENWRSLYPVAWADFHRFLKGWSPDHWKINSYSEKITRKVIQNL